MCGEILIDCIHNGLKIDTKQLKILHVRLFIHTVFHHIFCRVVFFFIIHV